MKALRNLMILNVCAYNRHQDKTELENKSTDLLLANCHPIDRELFIEKLNKLNKEHGN